MSKPSTIKQAGRVEKIDLGKVQIETRHRGYDGNVIYPGGKRDGDSLPPRK